MEQGRSRRRRTVNWFVPLIAALGIYFISVLISQQTHLGQISLEQESAKVRLQEAASENERLKQEREQLNDLSHVEQIAREELGMTKPGELPYSMGKKASR